MALYLCLITAHIGYWMPFEAARAIAATFCYGIRYALTPLFGPDFVSMCIRPSAEGYGQMVIDRQIVRRCAEQAKHYREMYAKDDHEATSLEISGFTPVPVATWASKSLRPQMARSTDVESGYCTDTDRSEHYLPSPQSVRTSNLTSAPRSLNRQLKLPSPCELLGDDMLGRGYNVPPKSPDISGNNISPKTKRRHLGPAKGKEGNRILSKLPKFHVAPIKRGRSPITSTKETRAAYVLMQLHFADTSLKDNENRAKKRRASS